MKPQGYTVEGDRRLGDWPLGSHEVGPYCRRTCGQVVRYGSAILCERPPHSADEPHAVHPSRVTASGPGHVTGIDR